MRADAQANRDAVVAAARRLVASKGTTVSVNAIAAEAGVGVATLYRHFATRDDLLYAIAVDTRERIAAIMDRYSAGVAPDPETWWASFVREVAALRPGALVSIVVDALTDGADVSKFVALRTEALESIETVVSLARGVGVVRNDLTAVQFQLGLATITRPLPTGADLPDLAEHERWLVETYIRGVRA
ncbi:TetR/AcrR family transcriptional regulator [Rhodococcus gannanensis]|uniref:TetR/AcrR family transcriptional regulator n=1 Tax=Rhodococcus gannanensis TaxID=1960308 RepID=A0ABW4NZX6_9NOCA